MKKSQRIFAIIAAIVLGSIAVSIVDGIIRPEYIVKSISKISVFLLVPTVYFLKDKEEQRHTKALFTPKALPMITAAIMGLFVYTVVMGAFFIFKDIIDFSAFTGNLTKTAGLTKNNFLFVSVYICIINSFMEELFFRALAFLSLKRLTGKRFAYIFASAAFALYHTGMTAAFVAPWVFILMLLGLFIGGLIFCFVDEKTQSIFPSWLCHMFANIATCTIGYLLLSGY